MSNLTCQLCGYSHPTMISPSHLKKHGITGADYKARFPGSVLRVQSPESKQKMSSSKSGKPAWNKGLMTGPNEKISLAKSGKENLKLRGMRRSEEQKANISAGTKRAMEDVFTPSFIAKLKEANQLRSSAPDYVPPMLGKTHSDETKRKLSEAMVIRNAKESASILDDFISVAANQNVQVLNVHNGYWFDFKCTVCSSSFTFTRQIFRKSTRHGVDICPTCFPRLTGRSAAEEDFFSAIKSLHPDALPNDRLVLGGKEIDVYLPSLKIGFEFTGLYWHAEMQNPVKKHLLWKKEHAANKGVQLFTVFEDEWKNSRDLVLSRIRSILGVTPNKIAARKCSVRNVASKERRTFLADNHLQGVDTASLALGLYDNERLVALASFKKTSISKGGDGSQWELSRLCSLKNTQVQGGAGKLISTFMKTRNHEQLPLISYADSRWSNGSLYKALGFEFKGSTAPSYWYLLDGYQRRVHRSSFMKHKLIECQGDSALTEWDLAKRAGMDRIWDCGTTKWLLMPNGC